MASGAALHRGDRAKVRIPFDLFERFDMLMDRVRARILESAYAKAGARKRGTQAWSVTDEDILVSTYEVLLESASVVEKAVNKHGTRSLRVRKAS
jgi:membrane protein required for beta-lactamase induction